MNRSKVFRGRYEVSREKKRDFAINKIKEKSLLIKWYLLTNRTVKI